MNRSLYILLPICIGFFLLFSTNAFSQEKTSVLTNQTSENQPSGKWTGSIEITNQITKLDSNSPKITLMQGIDIALKSSGENMLAQSAELIVSGGYLVYRVYLVDNNAQFHRILIDADDGKVLSNVEVSRILPDASNTNNENQPKSN
jgi:uncharacterized membrane protein YkoI